MKEDILEKVLILNFGGQYDELIARRVRESGVYSMILPYDTPIEKIKELNPKALIFTGGPESVYKTDSLFNGNGYGDEWIKEAEKRGLYNLKTTPDCLPYLVSSKNIDMLVKMNVFTSSELHARYHIQLENYCETTLIESRTMVEMVNEDYLPIISKYCGELSKTIISKKEALGQDVNYYEMLVLYELSKICTNAKKYVTSLEEMINKSSSFELKDKSFYIKDEIIPLMSKLRKCIDDAEKICPEYIWPYPGYSKLLFSII